MVQEMVNKQLVDELRQMFLDGATPSWLMHRIAQEHPQNPRIHFIIKDYFREAFCIPLLRDVVADEDYSPGRGYAHYIRDVIPVVLQRLDEWNSDNLQESWLNGISIRSFNEHTERLKSVHFEELDRVWETLTDKERLFIIRKVAHKDYFWEVMKGLAALAEQLTAKNR